MNDSEMVQNLNGVPEGSLLFVSYLAGRKPTEKAVREAIPHTTNPARPRRYFVGLLHRVWDAKNGDPILTMWVFNRSTENKSGALSSGGWRSFNPRLGKLIVLDVIRAYTPIGRQLPIGKNGS